jgi:hypothetical protein
MYAVQHSTPVTSAVAALLIFIECSRAIAAYPIMNMIMIETM